MICGGVAVFWMGGKVVSCISGGGGGGITIGIVSFWFMGTAICCTVVDIASLGALGSEALVVVGLGVVVVVVVVVLGVVVVVVVVDLEVVVVVVVVVALVVVGVVVVFVVVVVVFVVVVAAIVVVVVSGILSVGSSINVSTTFTR
jgi:hypothetical protein